MSEQRELLERPRMQHYFFAHRALPQLFYQRPEETLAILESEQGLSFLGELWAYLGQDVPPEGRVDFSGVFIEPLRRGGVVGVIVVLPAPVAMTEAYMVGMIARRDGEGRLDFSYHTLELGLGLEEGSRRTVLCAWTEEGSHLNKGDGPEPSVEAFAAAIGASWLH